MAVLLVSTVFQTDTVKFEMINVVKAKMNECIYHYPKPLLQKCGFRVVVLIYIKIGIVVVNPKCYLLNEFK